MADAQTPEEAFDALRSHLDSMPEALVAPRYPPGVVETDWDGIDRARPWVETLLDLLDAAIGAATSPSSGNGLDCVTIEFFCARLERSNFEDAFQRKRLSELVFERFEEFPAWLDEFSTALHCVSLFRETKPPGGLAITRAIGRNGTAVDRLRAIAKATEAQWIGENLPARREKGFQKETRDSPRYNALLDSERRFRDDAGLCLLRAADDLLLPASITSLSDFAHEIDAAFRSGMWLGLQFFEWLTMRWLTTAKPGYGGRNFDYPGAEKDDRERFNKGVRVARCASALADALEPVVVGSEQEPRPSSLSLAEDASPRTVLARLERFQLLMDGANASDSIRDNQAKGKEPAADVVQAAGFWTGGESQAELCALASALSEEAEFYQCAEGGRCLALVGLNHWQCLRRQQPINAYTIRQTLAELRSKLRAAIRREAAQQPANHSQTPSDHEPSREPIQAPKPTNTKQSGLASESEPDLLGKSLTRLRERFEDGFRRHQKLIGVMVHHSLPAQGPLPSWPDAIVEGMLPTRNYSGLKSTSEQLRGREDYALVADRPVLDQAGKPITNSAGDPIPMVPGWRRQIGLYGQHGRAASHEDVLGQSADAFDACCREAGSLVRNLDQRLKNVIWRDWTTAFTLPDDAELWVNAVFELAWQGHDGAGLEADRSGWLGRHSAPIDMIAKHLDGSMRVGMIDALAEAVGDPPGYWFSKLDNVWQASVAAIDLLASLVSDQKPEPGQSQLPIPELPPAANTIDKSRQPHPTPSNPEAPFEVDEALDQIRIDGEAHNVPSEATRMAKLLLEANGEWVGMAKNHFSKPSETKKKLPTAVQEMIVTEKGKGYRLRARR